MPVFDTEELEKALEQAVARGADALMSLPDGVTTPNHKRLAAWALDRRIPSAAGWSPFADSGTLLTYGPSVRDCYRRVGEMARQVLAGAKPAEMPIKLPTRFELVLNLRTAAALGLAVPQLIQAEADKLIE